MTSVWGNEFFNHTRYVVGVFTLPPRQSSPSSFTVSPYIVNFKRRFPPQNGTEATSESTGQEKNPGLPLEAVSSPESQPHNSREVAFQTSPEPDVFEMEIQGTETHGVHQSCNEGCSTNIPVPHGNHLSRGEASVLSPSVSSCQGEEFFDAPDAPIEEFGTEDEAFLCRSHVIDSDGKMIAELQEAAEVLRQIKSDSSLRALQKQWSEMARKFTFLGSNLSIRQSGKHEFTRLEPAKADLLEHLNQRLAVAKFVAAAVARGAARAEIDDEVESKNREIARLKDKLHYYEMVNREMSQRNQEVVEATQRRRKRRQSILSCLGTTFLVGTTAVLAFKYFPWQQVGVGKMAEFLSSTSDSTSVAGREA